MSEKDQVLAYWVLSLWKCLEIVLVSCRIWFCCYWDGCQWSRCLVKNIRFLLSLTTLQIVQTSYQNIQLCWHQHGCKLSLLLIKNYWYWCHYHSCKLHTRLLAGAVLNCSLSPVNCLRQVSWKLAWFTLVMSGNRLDILSKTLCFVATNRPANYSDVFKNMSSFVATYTIGKIPFFLPGVVLSGSLSPGDCLRQVPWKEKDHVLADLVLSPQTCLEIIKVVFHLSQVGCVEVVPPIHNLNIQHTMCTV